MNKKMIMGAVCALACVTNLAFSQPAEAGFLWFGNSGVMSASEQEHWSRRLNKQETGKEKPEISAEEDEYGLLPYIQKAQKRVCDVNGIQIVTNNFTDRDDYKTKVHPVGLVENQIDAYASGGGHYYIGLEGLRARNLLSFHNQYDYMAIEQTIAHETSHCIDGHMLRSGKEYQDEVLAEEGSIKYTDNLPEGGWGGLVAHNNNNCYPEIAKKIRCSFEAQTKNRVVIKSAADVLYRGKDNVLYPIIEERRGNESPANAYFGGQMAYCMSKDALSMGNIRIIRNHLKNEINYKGDYLLVCEDSNLPNGYRILTELYGDEATLQDNLDTLKSKVRSGILPLKKTGIPTWVLCG